MQNRDHPTIRVDREVYDAIKSMSTSWEDSPNTILRELLNLPKKKTPTKKKEKK